MVIDKTHKWPSRRHIRKEIRRIWRWQAKGDYFIGVFRSHTCTRFVFLFKKKKKKKKMRRKKKRKTRSGKKKLEGNQKENEKMRERASRRMASGEQLDACRMFNQARPEVQNNWNGGHRRASDKQSFAFCCQNSEEGRVANVRDCDSNAEICRLTRNPTFE